MPLRKAPSNDDPEINPAFGTEESANNPAKLDHVTRFCWFFSHGV